MTVLRCAGGRGLRSSAPKSVLKALSRIPCDAAPAATPPRNGWFSIMVSRVVYDLPDEARELTRDRDRDGRALLRARCVEVSPAAMQPQLRAPRRVNRSRWLADLAAPERLDRADPRARDEVAQALKLWGRDDDRPQLSGRVRPGELQRVTRVGLDAVAGLTRDRPGRADHHLHARGPRRASKPEPGRPGLIRPRGPDPAPATAAPPPATPPAAP